ncbi:PilX N-terminal domain-containing pilus assembly protein [Clostridium sp. WILCCON 0269]|uniref:PilX N-terminal domain-containing pilus assembly protein n=1 Tax=Candidatus Clostridium eludens TaxID=3381663 RepID=A0ABW8SHF5_9CLOT
MKKKGSALVIVIIIMMVVFMLAAFMVDTSVKSNRVASDTFNNTRAYYSAETGIYDFINDIIDKNCSVSLNESITNHYNAHGLYGDNMEVYTAKIIDIDTESNPKEFTINSTGNYGSQGYTIIAEVYITAVDNGSGGYNYSYSINSKKVYKS